MELVEFKHGGTYDADGNLMDGVPLLTVGATVYPTGAARIEDADFDGDTSRLTVLAPGGTPVQEGDTAIIRGREYMVVHVPFDWAVGRKPALARHKPRLEIHVEHREA